jgi:SAM-dependent methyltransferase
MGRTGYEFQKQFWGSEKKRREPWHPAIEAFTKPKIAYINRSISGGNSVGQLSLLDIGCGNGFFTYYLEKSFDTIALDFSYSMLKRNTSKMKLCGSAAELPFKNRSFDITFCSNLLHHLDEPDIAISEMKRVSRKYVIISEPNRNNPLMFLFGLLKKEERGTLRFSLRYMKQLVERSGLGLIGTSQSGIVLPNKTPNWLLPLLKMLDGEYPFAFYNIIISRRSL